MAIDKSLILANEARLIEAMKKNDLGYLGRVLHDDLVFLAPNGQVITKQMDLDSHARESRSRPVPLCPGLEGIRGWIESRQRSLLYAR